MNRESVARIIFIFAAIIVCEAAVHFISSFSEIDAIRLLVILILFEHIKYEKETP